jgi:hypothetical protein
MKRRPAPSPDIAGVVFAVLLLEIALSFCAQSCIGVDDR